MAYPLVDENSGVDMIAGLKFPRLRDDTFRWRGIFGGEMGFRVWSVMSCTQMTQKSGRWVHED
jgi:hypothetical protein